ncbi:hypothetical protein DPMN_094953 [Dreissena polymorpha]|uniref:Uncharacterized protein n=1 Tax=Dreissena polymorpha TaxID=45954 RepID=A0A9D4L600_DREPO|nr:hypothetical protein DPMN_094953 [Dreissena polymorpha]
MMAASVVVLEQKKGKGRATNEKREGNWFSDQVEFSNQHNAPDHHLAQKTNESSIVIKDGAQKKRSKLLRSQ